MKLVNVSPVGDLDVPLLRQVIAAGVEFDVTEAQATVLLAQPANYLPADVAATALRDKLAGTVTDPADDTPVAAPVVAAPADDAHIAAGDPAGSSSEGDDK